MRFWTQPLFRCRVIECDIFIMPIFLFYSMFWSIRFLHFLMSYYQSFFPDISFLKYFDLLQFIFFCKCFISLIRRFIVSITIKESINKLIFFLSSSFSLWCVNQPTKKSANSLLNKILSLIPLANLDFQKTVHKLNFLFS